MRTVVFEPNKSFHENKDSMAGGNQHHNPLSWRHRLRTRTRRTRWPIGAAFGGDPTQFRKQMEQRVMESIRESLEIKDDTKWTAIQPQI